MSTQFIPKILYTDFSIIQYSSSVATASSLLNLKTGWPTDFWVSAVTASEQQLVIDFGTATPRNYYLIDGHNLDTVIGSGSGIISIDAADNSTFTSGQVTVALLQAIIDSPSTQSRAPILYNEFPDVSKRYWRVLYSGSIQEPPQLATILIDKRFDITFPEDWGYVKEAQEFETTIKTNITGSMLTSNNFTGRLIYELPIPNTEDNTFKTNWQRFFNTVRGNLGNFYLFDSSTTVIRQMKLDSDYIPTKGIRFNRNAVGTIVMKSLETLPNWYIGPLVSTADGIGNEEVFIDY